MQRHLVHAAVAILLVLVALSLAWELWLAPLRPGGSWLVLKVLPLLAALRGLLAGRRHTYQWMSLCIWLYVAEGLVRVSTDTGPAAMLAYIETSLALGLFALCVVFARLTAPSRAAAR
jgi:uncharacterized membrane protein